MERYIQLAKDLKMTDALLITPENIVFDIRAILKCRWGCEEHFAGNIRCRTGDTSHDERLAMIKKYKNILLVHTHDAHELSKALLIIEQAAFHDGYYFAFALRFCHLCKKCLVAGGKDCPTPSKVRPCEAVFGIDVFKTARNLGLPCRPLQSENEQQNRYGFVLLD